MSIEEREVDFQGERYHLLMGEKVTTEDEVRKLLLDPEISNYFYGAVVKVGISQRRAFFGNGPDHEIFKQAVLEEAEMPPETPVDIGQVCTTPPKSTTITHIVFYLPDPDERDNNILVAKEDKSVRRRRTGASKALLEEISPDVCAERVSVRWEDEYNTRYVYSPKLGLLKKVPKRSFQIK